jgi:hypothetical protein
MFNSQSGLAFAVAGFKYQGIKVKRSRTQFARVPCHLDPCEGAKVVMEAHEFSKFAMTAFISGGLMD